MKSNDDPTRNSRAQYEGETGRKMQEQFRAKIAYPSIPLRKTGADMAGNDTTFELCFVVDSTGSMLNWIKRATETINEIIDKLVQDNRHMGNTIVRVALIGYRDVLDKGRFMEMQFTQRINDVKEFLQTFDAKSMEQNMDRPEDVAGAFKLCLMQDWTFESVKRVVLICDAPAHGYYDSPYANQDNYPHGTPDAPTLRDLTQEFKSKDIALQIVQLDANMTKMVNEMRSIDPSLEVIDMADQFEESDSDYEGEEDEQ